MLHEPGPILQLPKLNDLRTLAGKGWYIDGVRYRFKDYAPGVKGDHPFRKGREGVAYPLVAADDTPALYLKVFERPSQKRLDRTNWLIGQRIRDLAPSLEAAPRRWADTRQLGRPDGALFDFAGCLAKAVPGDRWELVKEGIAKGADLDWFSKEFRWRCVCDLIRGLTALEQAGIVHGDLSPSNIIVDAAAPERRPALYVIDFDAFVAPALGPNGALLGGDGGMYGTDGYCPQDLRRRGESGDDSIAPYSDRYGRDMLLLELLLMHPGLGWDDSPDKWDLRKMALRYQAMRARSPENYSPLLTLLDLETVLDIPEKERLASKEMAQLLGLEPRGVRPKSQGAAQPKKRTVPPPAAPLEPLEWCNPISKWVSSSEFETCAVTGVRALRSQMVVCAWLGRPILREQANKCELTGNMVARRLLDGDDQLAPLVGLLDGRASDAVNADDLLPDIRSLNGGFFRGLKHVQVIKSPLPDRMAVCCEIRRCFGLQVRYVGFLLSCEKGLRIIGKAVEGYRQGDVYYWARCDDLM